MFTNLRSSFRAVLVPAAVIAFAACDDDPTGPELTDDIVGIASSTSSVSTLVTALEAAGLVVPLQGDGPFTVFAPINAAFSDLGADVVAGLLEAGNLDLLARILTFHVVAGTAAFSDDLTDGQTVTTLEGSTLEIGVSGSGVTVNGARVTSADIEASNGVIHLIDEVLIPADLDVYETAVLTAGTTTLASAVLAADLDDDLQGAGPFTVFAPTNAAFAAVDAYTLGALLEAGNKDILERVLGFHVIAGQKIMAADLTDGAMVTTLEGSMLTVDLSNAADPKVNGVSITATDIEVSNGVIHLVDEVILPEFNIVETATLTEGFSTLVAAIDAAGIGAALVSETASLTVFAPTDAAFEALGGTLDLLLQSSNQPTLSALLRYHVLPVEVLSSGLSDGEVATLEGGNVTIDVAGPTVNGVAITATDIQASNGVIHVIDEVLLQGLDIVQRAFVTEQTTSLANAVLAGDLATTLQGAGPFTVFAPTNAAFEALGATADNLLDVADPAVLAALQDLLTYHVISGDYRAADLADGISLATVETGDVTFTADAGSPSGFKVNGANIVATDIEVENGVIHLIDDVLFESLDIVQRATVTDGTQTLAAAVAATSGATTDVADILSGAGPYTVFAPIDAAFEALGTDRIDVLLDPANVDLLSKVLAYHAVSGKVMSGDLVDGTVATLATSEITIAGAGTASPTVNGVSIIAADIVTENGVIHLIDEVLTDHLDLVDVATVEGFPTLVSLVEQQGLTTTLRGDNGGAGYTVFAPTEAAFAALSSVPSGDALTNVLLYHVVGATVESSSLTNGQVVNTAYAGHSFTVNINGSAVTITDEAGNTVNVVATDVPASNGIIHVVSAVLLPN